SHLHPAVSNRSTSDYPPYTPTPPQTCRPTTVVQCFSGPTPRGQLRARAMPELPDIVVYIEALARRVLHRRLERVRIANPFVLRTVTPPLQAIEGTTVAGFRRLGKRIAFELDNDVFLVLHLMIAGRLHWTERGAMIRRKLGLAAIDFEN